MFRRTVGFSAIRRLMNDSAPVRAMSLVHRFALHDGEGGAGGSGGKGKGDEGGGGDDGEGGDGGNDMPPEQQIGALKGKTKELLTKMAKAKPFVEFARGLGIKDVSKLTPEQTERLKAALADDDGAGAGAGKGDKALDARIKALTDGFDAEKKALSTRTERLGTALDKAMRKNAATDAIATHGGRQKLLGDHVDKHVKLVEDEDTGDFRVVVLDDDGEVLYNAKGKEMSPSEYVATLKESGEWDGAFDAPASKGGGSNGSKGGKGNASTAGKVTITEADARDATKYRAARKEAADAGVELVII